MSELSPENAVVWHDYPMGVEPTKCCGRKPEELPMGDGRTTDLRRVTCDGNFTPAPMAHEVYAHPSDRHDDPPTLEHAVKYHLARALAMYPPSGGAGDFDGEWMDRIALYLSEAHTACLMVALKRGLSGQEAIDFAHSWSSGTDGPELIYDLAHQEGVEIDRIRHYGWRKKQSTRPASEVDRG